MKPIRAMFLWLLILASLAVSKSAFAQTCDPTPPVTPGFNDPSAVVSDCGLGAAPTLAAECAEIAADYGIDGSQFSAIGPDGTGGLVDCQTFLAGDAAYPEVYGSDEPASPYSLAEEPAPAENNGEEDTLTTSMASCPSPSPSPG